MGMPEGRNVNLAEIITSISRGEYRIPRFQRDFVWDIKKSAALMDSIFRGYPISSVILWKTNNELNEIKKLGGIDIPDRANGRYISYIIDGQQRLTSLYFALNGLKTETGSDFSKMCVSLVASGDEQLVYESLPKDADPNDFVILADLFSAKALQGSHGDKRIGYFQILTRYQVSIIEIDDDTLNLEDVIEIFERLNLGGKKLNLFSIIAARSYRPPENGDSGFDLSKKFDKVNDRLANSNYGRINDAVFLQSIAACLIGKVNKADILRDLKSNLIVDNYEKVEKAFLAAIEHLKGNAYGAIVASLLPYQRLLVSFTYFHYMVGSTQIDSIQEKYLQDFFWRCILGKRYNTSADTNTNTDISKIQAILNKEEPTREPITLSPRSIFENGRFLLSSAYVLGMLCLMAQNKPQSYAVGRTVNITNDSVSNGAKKQFHHFFPTKSKAVTENVAYKAISNNVVNIVFMDAITNDQIKNDNPSVYISKFDAANPNLNHALEVQYISRSGFGIDDNNFYEFLNARSLTMYDRLRRYIIPSKHDSISGALPIDD